MLVFLFPTFLPPFLPPFLPTYIPTYLPTYLYGEYDGCLKSRALKWETYG